MCVEMRISFSASEAGGEAETLRYIKELVVVYPLGHDVLQSTRYILSATFAILNTSLQPLHLAPRVAVTADIFLRLMNTHAASALKDSEILRGVPRLLRS